MAQVSASGTTRLRVETIDDQARAGFNESDTLLNLRTTLAAQYEEGPVRVVGELWENLVTQKRTFGGSSAHPLSGHSFIARADIFRLGWELAERSLFPSANKRAKESSSFEA